MKYYIYIAAILSTLSISCSNHDHGHCNIEHDEHGDHEETINEHHDEANVVEFHDEEAKLIDFKLDTCKRGQLKQTIRTAAQIMPATQDEHVIVAKASGIIRLSAHAITGNRIEAGQIIATTNSNSVQGSLYAQQKQVEAEYERAEAEYKRKAKLAEEHIVSQKELESARAAYVQAQAAADNLNKISTNGSTIIKATETEYIRHLYVQNGQMVTAGSPIVSVSHNMKMLLKADVQPRYYKQLQQIEGANVMTNGEWHDIKEYNGVFVSCGRSTTADSPLLPVVFEIDGSADLVTGTFVDMYIKTATNEQLISVPTTALIEEMGTYFVFVKQKEGHYEKREVKIGQNDGYLTEIRSGLDEGEIVVSRGAIIVKLAMLSGGLDAHSGHVH